MNELRLARATLALASARNLLADREAALLLGTAEQPCPCEMERGGCDDCRGTGKVTVRQIAGRNEAERAAQLRQLTTEQRDAVATWDVHVTEERAELATIQAESSILRAVARLLASEDR